MTPLFKKLNLGDHRTILVLNPPESFEPELSKLAGIRVVREAAANSDIQFGIGFAVTQAELDSISKNLSDCILGDAILWVAYPKKTSKKYRCEFDRDRGWWVLGRAGFEAVRQVAIDQDWSAVRFRRVEYIRSLARRSQSTISAEGKRRTGG